MKRWLAAAALVAACASGAAAQENTVTAGVNAGLGLPIIAFGGVQASYEYSINSALSVGGNVFWEFFPVALAAVAFTNDPAYIAAYGFEGQVYWYPFRGGFYIGSGLGWASYMGMNTLVLTPGLGRRIDVGEPGGVVFRVGLRAEIFTPLGKNIFENSDESASLTPVNLLSANISVGYAF